MVDETRNPDPGHRAADWVEPMIGTGLIPEELWERCRLAGLAAYEINVMRAMRANDPFVPMSFGQYLKGLADLAMLSLEPVFATLGIEGPHDLDGRAIRRLARLARQLDISRRDALNYLRLSVAESAGRDASILVAAYRGGPALEDSCEKALTYFETEYDEPARQRLAAVLSAVEEEYSAHER